jgi:C1A family cysteine protease
VLTIAKVIYRQFILFFLVIFLSSFDNSSKVSQKSVIDLDKLRADISKAGAKWIAGETSVSRLTLEERKKLLLAKPPIPEVIAEKKPIPEQKPFLRIPTSLRTFDWRSVNGQSFVTPVRSQVGGTCVAFANTAAVESCILRSEGLHDNDINLSERVLAEINTGYPGSVAEFILSTGLPSESCFPWEASGPINGWQEQTYKVITHNYYPRYISIDQVKSIIVNVGPVVVAMSAPPDFFNYKGGVYSTTYTESLGIHEVLVIGFDDNAQCFICKNSWGVDWGEDGFLRIAYNQFGEGTTVGFGYGVDAYSGIIPPRRRKMAIPIALKTINGNTLTIVNGGGLGGPNSGPGVCALHSDAIKIGPWETFTVEWLNPNTIALKTINGNYVTAVNGGGIGGPNDSSSPIHTDATWVNAWEMLTLNYDAVTGKQPFKPQTAVTLQ